MTMEPELKAALADKIQIAQRELKDGRGPKVELEGKGRLTHLGRDEKRPNILYRMVQKKFKKERLWKPVQAALAKVAFDLFERELNRKALAADSQVLISAAKAKQLELFPGFEHLPTRIRSGNTFLPFPDLPLAKFLAYEKKYRLREQQNHETAQELRRMASMLEPFAEHQYLTVAAAYERATFRTAPAALTVVPREA